MRYKIGRDNGCTKMALISTSDSVDMIISLSVYGPQEVLTGGEEEEHDCNVLSPSDVPCAVGEKNVKHKDWPTGVGNMLVTQQKGVWSYSVPTTITPPLTTPPSPSPRHFP